MTNFNVFMQISAALMIVLNTQSEWLNLDNPNHEITFSQP